MLKSWGWQSGNLAIWQNATVRCSGNRDGSRIPFVVSLSNHVNRLHALRQAQDERNKEQSSRRSGDQPSETVARLPDCPIASREVK